VLSFLLTGLLLVSEPAPETRAALLERERAARAAALKPPKRSWPEALLYRIEDGYWAERLLNPPRGFFPWFGTFPSGAGLAAGPAFRHSNPHRSLTLSSAASLRGYWETGARLALTSQAPTRVFGDLSVGRREHTQEAFYGLGPDSSRRDRTSYAFRATSVGASFGVAPTRRSALAASAEYLWLGQGRGRGRGDDDRRAVEDRFDAAVVPGLGANPDYVRFGLRATLDTTDRPFGPHFGGQYVAAWDRFADRDAGALSFQRYTLDLRQYVPVLGSTRTLALRGHLVSLVPDDGHAVPFYLMPTLGGPDALRGLRTYRLRDRNAVLLQAEYRWDLNGLLRAVAFYERGTVGPRLGDLAGWHQDWGFGLRVGLLATVFARAEVALGGGEGTRVLLRFGNVY
jgi:hypothetical protein